MSKYPDIETSVLFALMRAGLWESIPTDMPQSGLSVEGWNKVYRMAHEQTITGLVYKGICFLPDDLMPPEDMLYRWVADADAIERRSRKMNDALAGLNELLTSNGLTAVVQKGQGIAPAYESPLLRECGDIDLYFPDRKQGEEAVRLAKSHGKAVRRMPDGSLFYMWEGFEVEQHTRLFDLHNPFLSDYLKELEHRYGFRQSVLSTIPDAAITVPSPTLNLLLLSTHIMKHTLGRGIGLRQLCDMARVCHKNSRETQADVSRDIARRVGTFRWSLLLHTFLVEHLGLPEPELPFADKAETSQPLLDRILAGGNFGMYRREIVPENDNACLHKLNTACAVIGNVGFSFRYAPKESWWQLVHLIKRQISY